MGKEVDMQEAPAAQEPKEQAEDAGPAPPSVQERLRSNLQLIDKAVRFKETRAMFGKLLRQTTGVRKQLTAAELRTLVSSTLPAGSPAAQTLLQYLGPQVSRQFGHGGALYSHCSASFYLIAAPELPPPLQGRHYL